jgi:predicted O-methyltransferase YrrM
LTLHLVDSWGDYEPSLKASGDYHADLTDAAQETYFQRTSQAVSSFGERAIIHRAKSVQAAETLSGVFDFVFIDADHSYEGCRSDIEAWAGKIRAGGLLCGHDYDNVDYPQWGVKRAVDEYVAAHGLTLELGDNFTWFVKT